MCRTTVNDHAVRWQRSCPQNVEHRVRRNSIGARQTFLARARCMADAMTLGRLNSSSAMARQAMSASPSNTSRPAPPSLPSSSAARRACSSINPPRDVFIKMADDFHSGDDLCVYEVACCRHEGNMKTDIVAFSSVVASFVI